MKKKNMLSTFIFIDNYIGNSTNLEIEYAKKLKKEIIYYIDLIKK